MLRILKNNFLNPALSNGFLNAFRIIKNKKERVAAVMRLRLLITFCLLPDTYRRKFGLDLTVILPAAAMDPMMDLGWEWLIGWGILAGGLITVLRVMVKKDKIVLKLGNVEENPDGTMIGVCAISKQKAAAAGFIPRPCPQGFGLDLPAVAEQRSRRLSADHCTGCPGGIVGGGRPSEADYQPEPASCRR